MHEKPTPAPATMSPASTPAPATMSPASTPASSRRGSRGAALDAWALQRSVGNRATGSLVGRAVLHREPNKSVAPPNATTIPKALPDRLIFEGQILSPDPVVARETLEKVGGDKGVVGMEGFVNRFANPSLPTSVSALPAPVDPKLRESIVATLNAQVNALKTEAFSYRNTFEQKATAITKEMLDHSEKKINEEQARYGIKLQKMPTGTVVSAVDQPSELVKMQKAALLLVPEKKASSAAFEAWSDANQKVIAKSGPAGMPLITPTAEIAAEQAARKKYTDAEAKYHQLRIQQIMLFPALAMFAGAGESATSLEQFASVPPSLLGQHIGALMVEKLANIAKVRAEIGGRFSIWKQPTVMNIAGQQLNTKPWMRKAMDDHAKELKADEASSKLMWAAVAVGLGLLAAIPTGGSSVIAGIATAAAVGGAGLSAYNTYEEVQKASLAQAASGTDMDKAASISKEDPSWGWLAMDILGSIADVVAAGAAFKALKAAITTAKAANAPLRPLVNQVRSYKLSIEAEAHIMKEVVTGEKVTTNIKEALEVFRTMAETTTWDPKLAKALHAAAEDFVNRGKVLVLNHKFGTIGATREIEAFVKARSFNKTMAEEITARLLQEMETADGLYYGTLDIVIARGEGSAERVATIIAHELAHSHQKQWLDFAKLTKFEKEVQAWAVEGEFLRMLPPGSVPEDYKWLATATLKEIEGKVLANYTGAIRPEGFDAASHTKAILESLRSKAP